MPVEVAAGHKTILARHRARGRLPTRVHRIGPEAAVNEVRSPAKHAGQNARPTWREHALSRRQPGPARQQAGASPALPRTIRGHEPTRLCPRRASPQVRALDVWRWQQSVKPPAQPTLVRTQHLPPPRSSCIAAGHRPRGDPRGLFAPERGKGAGERVPVRSADRSVNLPDL